MARVVVMNPPKRRKKPRRSKIKFKRKPRRVRRRKSRPVSAEKIVRRRKRTRKFKKRARKMRRVPKRHFNPFGSEMIMLGNPRRHKRRKTIMARRKRRHHRRGKALLNPFSASGLLSKPREMFTTEFVTEAASTAAGFMLPNIVLGMFPVAFKDSKLKIYASKILVIAGLSTVAAMVNKKASRFVLIGGGVALLLDMWAEWQARSMPAPGTSAYYGNEDMSAYYGGDPYLGDDDSVVG